MPKSVKTLSLSLHEYACLAAFLLGCKRSRRRSATRDHMLLRAVGAAVLGAAALSVIDMGSKRIAQSPPPGTALKVLTPQVAAGSSLTGAELWSSSPLVALVLRRPG